MIELAWPVVAIVALVLAYRAVRGLELDGASRVELKKYIGDLAHKLQSLDEKSNEADRTLLERLVAFENRMGRGR